MTATEIRHVVRGLVPIFQAMQKRLEAVETKAAQQGPPGQPGRDGLPGLPGLTGEKGADGMNGKDGDNGFDGCAMLFDEQKGYSLRLSHGDQFVDMALPITYDAGLWEGGRMYPKGAGVTVRGMWWIAQTDTKSRPGDDTTWRMAVKAGRDGKDGKPGPAGKDWMPGDPR